MPHAQAQPQGAAKPSPVGPYLQHHRAELLALLDTPGSTGVAFARRHDARDVQIRYGGLERFGIKTNLAIRFVNHHAASFHEIKIGMIAGEREHEIIF